MTKIPTTKILLIVAIGASLTAAYAWAPKSSYLTLWRSSTPAIAKEPPPPQTRAPLKNWDEGLHRRAQSPVGGPGTEGFPQRQTQNLAPPNIFLTPPDCAPGCNEPYEVVQTQDGRWWALHPDGHSEVLR